MWSFGVTMHGLCVGESIFEPPKRTLAIPNTDQYKDHKRRLDLETRLAVTGPCPRRLVDRGQMKRFAEKYFQLLDAPPEKGQQDLHAFNKVVEKRDLSLGTQPVKQVDIFPKPQKNFFHLKRAREQLPALRRQLAVTSSIVRPLLDSETRRRVFERTFVTDEHKELCRFFSFSPASVGVYVYPTLAPLDNYLDSLPARFYDAWSRARSECKQTGTTRSRISEKICDVSGSVSVLGADVLASNTVARSVDTFSTTVAGPTPTPAEREPRSFAPASSDAAVSATPAVLSGSGTGGPFAAPVADDLILLQQQVEESQSFEKASEQKKTQTLREQLRAKLQVEYCDMLLKIFDLDKETRITPDALLCHEFFKTLRNLLYSEEVSGPAATGGAKSQTKNEKQCPAGEQLLMAGETVPPSGQEDNDKSTAGKTSRQCGIGKRKRSMSSSSSGAEGAGAPMDVDAEGDQVR
ncbi:unnamed protein product [Amoebophrya sp. A120]|nr:unnamed protein product [Amoebophrya sp. A120]|eukprot:GSA120T00018533001.1